MKPLPITMLVLAAACLTASTGDAQSIWKQRQTSFNSYFADTKAREVGDLITIIVSESTTAANRDSRNLRKNHENNGNFALAGATGDAAVDADLDFGTESARGFGGTSEFSTTRGFEDRITVEVRDVLPNGNLLIGGKREVMVQGDRRTLVASGMVRGLDISRTNTVNSTDVAHFVLRYDGQGRENSFTRQGWFSRVFNVMWPF